MITSDGYRIGPGEIEDCLLAHPAVDMAAVVGVPDPLRTEIVKAYIVVHDGIDVGEALVTELQLHVKTRLSGREYPRQIEFVASLPMTATGKIIRREPRGPRTERRVSFQYASNLIIGHNRVRPLGSVSMSRVGHCNS